MKMIANNFIDIVFRGFKLLILLVNSELSRANNLYLKENNND
jgi:hypothetical protein